MLEQIKDLLKRKDVKYRENSRLCELSAIKIGGEAPLSVYPSSEEELLFTLRVLREFSACYKVLGRMSNVLPPDEKYQRVVVKTDNLAECRADGCMITAGAGVPLPYLAYVSAGASLSGLEELSGIPGSLGGTIFGNAGAYGREISELLESVRLYLSEKDECVTLSPSELEFSYRQSKIKNMSAVILSAKLRLSYSDSERALAKIRDYRERRLRASPGEPSLGSTFKRPPTGYASKMIDECGLRGYRHGGASISSVHAGYIVNLGGATASDVKVLVRLAEKRVYDRFGIRLEREIEYL